MLSFFQIYILFLLVIVFIKVSVTVLLAFFFKKVSQWLIDWTSSAACLEWDPTFELNGLSPIASMTSS